MTIVIEPDDLPEMPTCWWGEAAMLFARRKGPREFTPQQRKHRNEYSNAYAKAHKEKIKKHRRRYYAKHRKEILAKMETYRKRQTPEQLEAHRVRSREYLRRRRALERAAKAQPSSES